MANLERMSQVLYHHDWVRIEDWAQTVAELADLNDDQIAELPHRGCVRAGAPTGFGPEADGSQPPHPSSIGWLRRMRQWIADDLGLPPRRDC